MKTKWVRRNNHCIQTERAVVCKLNLCGQEYYTTYEREVDDYGEHLKPLHDQYSNPEEAKMSILSRLKAKGVKNV